VKLYWDARRQMEFLQVPENWLLLLLLLWSHIQVHVINQVFQSCKHIWEVNLILFFSLTLFSFLRINLFILSCSITCWQSLPNFWSHQIMFSITAPLNDLTSTILEYCPLSIMTWWV
jgi:hypothetical protein